MSESSELARGRSRKKSKINADQTAMVRMPDGTIEQLDAGTLLSDLIRSFGPHAHLIEVEDTIALTSSFQVSSPLSHPSSSSSSPPPPPVALVSGLVHRAASYELKVGSMYRLVIDEPSSSSSSTASGEEVRLLSKQVATLLETLNQTLGNTNRLLLQDRSSLMGTPPSDLEENEREIGETEAEKIAKFQAFELASSRSLSSIQRGPHAATPSMAASSATSSMLSAFTMTRSNCSGCHGPISMMSMRKKCAVCQLGYCRRCCRLKISLPIYYGYDRTKYVCKNCLPRAFLSRHGISLDGGDIELQKNHGSEVNLKLKLASLSNSSPDIKNLIGRLVKGTFYTLSSGTISFSMKIFDPIVRFSFWWSGMKEGDKFDRTALEAAMGAKVSPYQNHMEAVVRVPQDWKVLGKRTPVEEPEILHKISGRRQWDASIKTYDVQMLLYFPKKSQVSAPDQPLPAVVYYHGGGFCIGHASDSSYHTLCYKMAKKSGSVVISVEYRLAPESKYPTQLEDGYAAFHWVHSNSAQFNIDKNRIAVSGDSAGGTIAAVVSLLSRDRGAPTPCHQLLYYPCLTDPITDEIPSQAKYSAGPVLTRDVLKWFMSSLFDNYEHEMKTSCYANPLMWIDSFEGIPPATIINAMHDPLADHGKMYAWRLRRAGIPVHHSVYTNCVHGFICSVGLLPEANEALAEGVVFLRRAFDTLSPAPTPLVSPRTTASLSSSLRCTS